jgi:signal transduction histidine kinase
VNVKEHLIVYVDDERPNRIVFEQSFGARFNVRALPSGQAALELLRNETAAVLITDQRMPDMSGHELLVKVKQLYPDMIRVVITAYSDLDPILAAVNEGLVARYIIKPWDRAELEQILLWSLEAFSLGRQKSALQLRLMQTERLVTLGSMAAAVLHDLHQPLTNLTVNIERLAEHVKALDKLKPLLESTTLTKKDRALVQELTGELPELSRDLLMSCQHMTNMTIGLKQFLKAEPRPEPSGVDPVPIIHYAMGVCREAAVRARGRIVYEGPPALPKLLIGSTELTQVLINVVANGAQALLARNKSGGRVVVSAAEVEGGDQVRLTVEDNGPGMSADVLGKVGTPFFSTRPDGTGLGVAQCRRLVEGAGGTFRIESVEGQGTTVTFTLPKVGKG